MIAFCSAAVCIGSLLPWIAVNDRSALGIYHGGGVTFGIGLAGLAAFASNRRTAGARLGNGPFLVLSSICALGAAAASVASWNAFPGIGLVLTVVAVVGWLVATIRAAVVRHRERATVGDRPVRRERTRASRHAQPRRARGLLVAWLGPPLVWAVALAVMVPIVVSRSASSGDSDLAVWALVVGIFLVANTVGRRLHRHGKQLAAAEAFRALETDQRAPVLLLRSFAADDAPFRQSWRRGRFGAQIFPPTYEEALTQIFRDAMGPVIAIGNPREELPSLGAARMYVADDAWEKAVLDLLKQAQLVVVHAGESAGVLWEVAQVLDRVPPDRFLLSLPRYGRGASVDHESYERFRTATAALFPRPLPTDLGRAEFMFFDDDWTARLLDGREFATRNGAAPTDRPRERAIAALAPAFQENPVLFWYRVVLLGAFAIGLLVIGQVLLALRA